ncbi:hypothetical protein Tco_1124945 [Tanacetum coccineum]|uniref:Uncharacterized protein n=1 Tax=Tanacetum coccineum TaxID=301880 RepID=A0ABQ5J923_9ASTR
MLYKCVFHKLYLISLFTSCYHTIFHKAQQAIPAAQLVPKYHTIGRCNNYTVLYSIPCSLECKIIGQILLDHPLSYALTAIADVPTVYLQQFWRTVSKVLGPEEMIKFMLNTQQFVYTVDMVGYQGVVDKVSAFYMKNLAQPWQTMFKVFNHCLTTRTFGHDQTNINILQMFHAVINQTNGDYATLLWWDFMNNMKQKKEAIQIEEDSHSINDDIPLVSVYTTGDVCVQGMLIPDEFLTEEIRSTDDFKEYEMVFMNVDVPMNQPQPGKKRKQSAGESSSPRQSHKITIKRKKPSTTLLPPPSDDRERDEIAKATLLSLTLHKTALAAKAQENIAKVQERLAEEEIEKMIEGDEDEESYASEFFNLVLNDDVDDSSTRLVLGGHKENQEKFDDNDAQIDKDKDDEEIEKEVKDDGIEKDKINEEIVKEKKADTVEKMNEVVKEKDIIDDVTGSMEIRKEQKSKTLPGSIAGMCRRRGLIRSHIKNKFVTYDFFMSKIRETLDHCNKVVPNVTFMKTKEMITQEMTRLVNLAVNKDREVDPISAKEIITKEFATHRPKMIEELFRKHMQNTTLNLYPTTSSLTAAKSSADLQQQLYLNMKSRPQDQAADPEL